MIPSLIFLLSIPTSNNINTKQQKKKQRTHPNVLESMVFSARTSRTEGALTELAAEDTEDFKPPTSRSCWSLGRSAPALTTDVMLWSFLMACWGSLTVLSADMYSFDLNWASCCWSRSSCNVDGMSIRFLLLFRIVCRQRVRVRCRGKRKESAREEGREEEKKRGKRKKNKEWRKERVWWLVLREKKTSRSSNKSRGIYSSFKWRDTQCLCVQQYIYVK